MSFQEVKSRSREAMRDRMYRRRFLVPNLITLANMFCGFIAIIYASNGKFDKAVLAIGIAILLDGLDGRVARRLNATSKFGVEFDSFSDLVSFGVAPAILVYFWCFQRVSDEYGVLIAFLYTLCAAARLARFNVASENLKNFTGLPTPGAAGVVAALVNFYPTIAPSVMGAWLVGFFMFAVAFLMVSSIPFWSIKQFKVQHMNLVAFISLGLLIALTWKDPQVGLLALASLYVLSGPVLYVRDRRLKRAHPVGDNESAPARNFPSE